LGLFKVLAGQFLILLLALGRHKSKTKKETEKNRGALPPSHAAEVKVMHEERFTLSLKKQGRKNGNKKR
jgi:hypothetical protein